LKKTKLAFEVTLPSRLNEIKHLPAPSSFVDLRPPYLRLPTKSWWTCFVEILRILL